MERDGKTHGGKVEEVGRKEIQGDSLAMEGLSEEAMYIMETQRMRISTDPDTENSKDDGLSGKGLDWRNRKTSLPGTRKQRQCYK